MHRLADLLEDPTPLDAALAAETPLLRDAKLKVTSRCNLACRMCEYWKTTHEQTLTLEEWRRVIDELAAHGCQKLHVSGGEPFLRPDLLELLAHGVARGLKVNMTTNGTLLDRERAQRLVATGLNAVSISLDGPSSKLHDRVRGRPGAFKRSVRAIRWIARERDRRGSKLKLRINFVLMPDTFRRLPDMVRLAGELGAVDLIPMPVDGLAEQRLSRQQLELFNAEVAPAAREAREALGFPCPPERVYPYGTSADDLAYAKLGRYARGYHERRPCYAPWLHTFVAWNGDVFLCCMTANASPALGNLRQSSVAEVLGGEAYAEVRRSFLAGRMLPHCHRCDLFTGENQRLQAALDAARPPARRLLVLP
ncbi:MAG: radical SAM protein [Planctomycetes bacterium]|nr:radical SAM protein [Planctomycetota bacterium]